MLRLWRQKPNLVFDHLWHIHLHWLLSHASLTRCTHFICQIYPARHKLDVATAQINATGWQWKCGKNMNFYNSKFTSPTKQKNNIFCSFFIVHVFWATKLHHQRLTTEIQQPCGSALPRETASIGGESAANLRHQVAHRRDRSRCSDHAQANRKRRLLQRCNESRVKQISHNRRRHAHSRAPDSR